MPILVQIGKSRTTLVREARARRALIARLARTDVNTFCEFVLKDEGTGAPLRQSGPHALWHKLADEHDRLLVWSHIEAGKSLQLSIGRTLWELGRDPNLRHVILSNTANQAKKLAAPIRRYVESSDELHEVFPHLRPGSPWGDLAFSVERSSISKDPSIQVSGVHGNVLGARLDRVVMDDVLDYENTATEDSRKGLIDWVLSSIVGRLVAEARVRVVGTGFHPQDLLHYLARHGYAAFRYPVVDAAGQPRWPERWPLERIAKKAEELGPIEAARQLMCEARDDSTARFKREYIEVALRLGEGTSLASALQVVPAGYRTFTGVDLAVQQKDANDETVLFTIAVDPYGNRSVLNIEAGRWTGPEIVLKINQHHQRYQSIVVVENNACFPAGARVLTAEGYRPIEQVIPGTLVMTHLGNWQPVQRVTSRPYQGKLITVEASGGVQVQCTPNHAFWVKESGRVRGGRKAPDVGKHRPVGEPGWASACTLRAGDNGTAFYAGLSIPKWPETQAEVSVTRYKRQTLLEIDEPMALVIGLYLAEGGGGGRSQVQFTLGPDERYIADFIAEVVQDKLQATVCHHDLPPTRARRLVVNSIEAKRLFNMGGGKTKCLPWTWMGWPLAIRLAIVRGWLVGDGCLQWNNQSTKWSRQFLSGSSCSRDLVAQMRFTLLEAGLRPALNWIPPKQSRIGDRVVNGGEAWGLALNATDTATLLGMATTSVERRRWGAFRVHSDMPEAKSRIVIQPDAVWSKLAEVSSSTEDFDGLVYNLVVDQDHSYVVEDLAVHNSQDFIVQFARVGSAVPIIPFTTGRNKAHPEFGVESLAAEFASGKWRIPNRGGVMHPEVAKWVDEMLFYNPRAHTGDRLVASWFSREGARLGAARKVESVGNVDLNRR